MSPTESVTHWIAQLQAGDEEAAQKLWEQYFQRLVALARCKLHGARRGAADEEDVALSALDSFYRGLGRGRFPRVRDRDNLWRLLVVITARKALNLKRQERARKRGGGAVAGESGLRLPDEETRTEAGIEHVVSREPTPEFAAQVAEEYQRLLDRLARSDLETVARWKMEGFTNDEIAAKLGCVPRTIERKLRVIRSLWEQETDR
jgi:DNA-directed RNA polymerase specialized sigma24 family protein